jgi:hypothetical protein
MSDVKDMEIGLSFPMDERKEYRGTEIVAKIVSKHNNPMSIITSIIY